MINRIVHFKKITSTNDYLKDHYEEDSGLLVYSDFQTSGKGRRGNRWESQRSKNLMFSFLLKNPELTQQELMMKVTIALINTLEEYGLKGHIKLPNDILVNNKKLSGVLIESIYRDKNVYTIVGIGLNVNQIMDQNRTSIKQELMQSVHRKSVLLKFISYYNLIDKPKFEIFKDRVLIPKLVRYQDSAYEWVDFNQNWQAFIRKDDKTKIVSIEEIEFDYTLYL